jgi:hypothetical protein
MKTFLFAHTIEQRKKVSLRCQKREPYEPQRVINRQIWEHIEKYRDLACQHGKKSESYYIELGFMSAAFELTTRTKYVHLSCRRDTNTCERLGLTTTLNHF